MTRTVWVSCPDHPDANEFGSVEKWKATQWRNDQRREAGFNVISDTMDETRHMADGKYYTSKSEYRKATRASGCIEVGNDTAPLLERKTIYPDRQQLRNDIGQAINMLKNGYRPF